MRNITPLKTVLYKRLDNNRSQAIMSVIWSALFMLCGQGAAAKFYGAELSAGWKDGKVSVRLVQFFGQSSDASTVESADLITSTGVVFKTIELKQVSISPVQYNTYNPCQEMAKRNIQMAIYEGVATPDIIETDYEVQWKSVGITQSLFSTEPLVDNPVVLKCDLQSQSKDTQKIIIRQNAPPFIMCHNQPFAIKIDITNPSTKELALINSPIKFGPSTNPGPAPPTEVPEQGNNSFTLNFNKGFSLELPMGKEGYKVNGFQDISYSPSQIGNYIIQENTIIKDTEITLHSRVYLVEVVQ